MAVRRSVMKALEVWESSNQKTIDGNRLGTLHVPIQYQSKAVYDEALANAPVTKGWSSPYNQKAIFVYNNAEQTTLTPSVAFAAYDSVLDPYLWSALVCLTQDYNRAYENQVLATEPLLFRPSLTIGTYVHLTYTGSRYGYVTGPVSASRTDDNGNGGGEPVFASGATRVDYLTGATANSGVVGRLIQSLTIRTYKAGSYLSGIATTDAGVQGYLYDFFVDEETNALCSGQIHVNLWDFYDIYGYYRTKAVAWKASSSFPIATDLNAQWLLNGPEVSQYHYLLADGTGTIYTYNNGVPVPLPDSAQRTPTASMFLQYGPTDPPTADCIRYADADISRVYKWTAFYHTALPLSAYVRGIPANNTITGTADLTGAAALARAWAHAAGDVRIRYSVDGGQTWTETIPLPQFLARSPEAMFPEMQTFGPVIIQLSLWADGTSLTDFGIEWNTWDPNAFDLDSFLRGVQIGQKLRIMDARR